MLVVLMAVFRCFGASLCVAISSVSIAGCSVDSVVFLDVAIFEFLSCRKLFALVRDALLLLRNSHFHLDLVHDLIYKHLGVNAQVLFHVFAKMASRAPR